MEKGLLAFLSLFVVFFVIGACARISDLPLHEAKKGAVSDIKEADFPMCTSCTRDEAEEWATAAEKDLSSALKGANCYAFLVAQEEDKASKLADAKKGRELAETAVKMLPKSGLTHYLYAYLTGLEAENDPLRGLDLVPVIEREALLASDLNPAIDRGGPDRMLGELYLRAPGIPVSIGDPEKAIAHYQRALAIAPACPENRMGLVEALLKEGDVEKACMHLHELLSDMPPARSLEVSWRKALGLLKQLCSTKRSE
ncbi:MAG: tetratricopeptide repeat protein [Desulfobacteraceae bacterium]|nr:tetratricopeptide repeat protein [Desulfobacteraceae bacterium]